MRDQQKIISQKECEHPSWYQEGEGEGAVRCCRSCGLIAVCYNPSKPRPAIDLSTDKAAEIRKRAGIPEDIVTRLSDPSSDDDINQQLLHAKRERSLYGSWAVMYGLFIGLFHKWILEPCKTQQQVINMSLLLGAAFLFIIYRAMRAHYRIGNIVTKADNKK